MTVVRTLFQVWVVFSPPKKLFANFFLWHKYVWGMGLGTKTIKMMVLVPRGLFYKKKLAVRNSVGFTEFRTLHLFWWLMEKFSSLYLISYTFNVKKNFFEKKNGIIEAGGWICVPLPNFAPMQHCILSHISLWLLFQAGGPNFIHIRELVPPKMFSDIFMT